MNDLFTIIKQEQKGHDQDMTIIPVSAYRLRFREEVCTKINFFTNIWNHVLFSWLVS